jgi:hypothetical protein
MGAGLERYVHRRPRRVLAALATIGQRGALRVQAAELGVEPFAGDPSVADDHRADQGIGAHPSPASLGKGERALQELVIGG